MYKYKKIKGSKVTQKNVKKAEFYVPKMVYF